MIEAGLRVSLVDGDVRDHLSDEQRRACNRLRHAIEALALAAEVQRNLREVFAGFGCPDLTVATPASLDADFSRVVSELLEARAAFLAAMRAPAGDPALLRPEVVDTALDALEATFGADPKARDAAQGRIAARAFESMRGKLAYEGPPDPDLSVLPVPADVVARARAGKAGRPSETRLAADGRRYLVDPSDPRKLLSPARVPCSHSGISWSALACVCGDAFGRHDAETGACHDCGVCTEFREAPKP